MITPTTSTRKETKSEKSKCLVQIYKSDKWMLKKIETKFSESYFITHTDVQFNSLIHGIEEPRQ